MTVLSVKTIEHSVAPHGGEPHQHVCGVEIRVKLCRQEDVDHLKEERRDLERDCAAREVSHLIYDISRNILGGVENAFASRDPDVIALAAKTSMEFRECFKNAGFEPIFMESIANEYHSTENRKDAYGLRSPWFIVTTRLGHFKVGWRKRVISLDWSRTTVMKTADQIFPNEVTKGERDIHAWSYEALTKYLRAIGEA